MIRVVLAEDHHLVRQGLRSLLEGAEDIEVVGEAADGHEAIVMVEQLAPAVLVMDLAMPRLSGAQATERIGKLGLPTRVVILSMYSRKTLVRQALRSGAVGYVLKSSVAEELLLAIRAANRGDLYLSPAVSRPIVKDALASDSSEESSDFTRLTRREREVLKLVAEGHTNRSIALILKIAVKTVDNHRANLMAKLGIHDVAGLTRIAIQNGLVFLDE